MLKDRIAESLKTAIKEKDKRRVSTLRLVQAAIQDRDIALRGKGKEKADEDEILDLLGKMIKQREESARLYAEGGRSELEAQELEEIEIIREFMPEQLSEAETETVIGELIAETGAESLRDMGKVMGLVKERFRGQVDMGRVGGMIKKRLGG